MLKQTQYSWQLAKQSLKLVKTNKQLLLLPLASSLLVLVIFTLIAIPFWRLETQALETQKILLGYLGLIYILVFFFIANFLINFFNSTLIIASRGLSFGEKPISVLHLLKQSLHKVAQIFLWTLTNTTIGILIRLIENWSEGWHKHSIVQRNLAGLNWSLATYFTLSITALEKISTIQAISNSANAIRKKWGNTKRTNYSLRFILFPLRLFALLPLILSYFIGGSVSIVIGSAITITLFLGISTFNSATTVILQSILYTYIFEQKIIAPFNAQQLEKFFS